MSLLQFFQKIDGSAVGKFIDRKLNVLNSLNPDRIYVEIIRSFYNMPFRLARFFCEMAVKENLFFKKIGVICPNDDCERIIMSVDSHNEIPEHIHCDNCELLERERFEFTRDEIKTVEFYQLNPYLTHGGQPTIETQ